MHAETGEAAAMLGRVIGGYSLETCLSLRSHSMLFRGVKRGAGEAQTSEAMVRVFRRPHDADAHADQALQLERLEALRTLHHPGIARVIAFGIEGEALYVVTSPFRNTLADVLPSQPDYLPLDDIQAIISQLAYALDYAHTQGVTHGNISPQHVALDGQGGPYLCGFELAPLQGSAPPLEQGAAKHGAGRFASAPAREESCGNDIRRLCALLYALTVAPALPADERFFSSTQPIDPQLIRPMGEVRKGVPAAAEAVVLHALTAQDDPFPCASHLARAFAVGLSGEWTVSVSRYARVTKHRQVGSPEPPARRADLPVPRVSVRKALRAADASVRQGAAGVPLALMVVLPASAFPIGQQATQPGSEALAHGTTPHSAIDRQATEPAALPTAGTTPDAHKRSAHSNCCRSDADCTQVAARHSRNPDAHAQAVARSHVDPTVAPVLAMMHRARGVPRRGDCTGDKVMAADDVGAR